MISSQLMHRDIVTIRPMESIQTAARKMRDKHADVVVVLGDNGIFKGLLTEKEVIMAAMNSGDAEQVADYSPKREVLPDCAFDDGNRCNYFSEVAKEVIMAAMNSGDAELRTNASATRKDLLDLACDDGNRCNYFSEVAVDLLMSR
ncbi:MAG TPA: CBS domain-containing protein [Thermodesulfovibrionales bacterium]|nr:CBS domain-containing protein [Thermodesulfovibrionales bacterium]